MGGEAWTATNGSSGIRLARTFLPDLILLDIGMPGLDGYQVAERIRTALGDDAPRLVAVTGFGSTKDKARAREAGFDAHIVKPARPLDLRRALMKRATPQAPSTTNRERHAHDRPAEAGDAHQEAQGRRKRNGKDTRRQRPKRGGGKPHA
jgi:CheY-like chemotaxis protein